jgi:hypothetical protein
MTNVTIITPIAPYHADLVQRAIDSVKRQTVPCIHLMETDTEKRGPAYIRNKLLSQAQTPLIIFLDADDWIESEYVARCMEVIEPRRYVYTDWLTGDTMIKSPRKAWCGGSWHPITTLLWTHDVKSVGGFDEELSAQEDTDFYLKLTTRRHCGIHLELPLFHYGTEGKRALESRTSGREIENKEILQERYKNKMGCCGENQKQPSYPLGERQPGDILAMATWGGNRKEYGRATGRRYPRMSYPQTTWINPRDLRAKPDHWQQIDEPSVDDPYTFHTIEAFADSITGGSPKPEPVTVTLPEVPEGGFTPSVDFIVETAKKKLME